MSHSCSVMSTEEQQPLLEPSPQPRAVYPLVMVVAISGITTFIYGFTTGFSSPSAKELQDAGVMDLQQVSWYGSVVILGAILGSVAGTYLGDALGRKRLLLLVSGLNVLGWGLLMLGLQASWTGTPLLALLYTGRVLTGVASALTICSYPVYIAETAPKTSRGLLGASTMVFIHCVILAAYGLSIPLHSKWVCVVPLALSLLHSGLSTLLPESPAWLLTHGHRVRAMEALRWLRGGHTEELQDTEQMLVNQEPPTISYAELKQKTIYVPLVLGLVLGTVQVGGGINVVVFYSIQILQDAGFQSDPALISVVIGAVLLLSDVPPVFLVDRVGRRALLILSAAIMATCYVALGLYFYLTQVLHMAGLSALSLTAILLSLIGFGLGLGSVVMVVVGEIFSLRARGTLLGLVVVVANVVTFVELKEFFAMIAAMEAYGTFWFFAGVNVFGLAIIALFLPETKGRSLEEIEEYFRGNESQPSPRHSANEEILRDGTNIAT